MGTWAQYAPSAIWKHQFPTSCSDRSYLFLHDDLQGAGLGFTAKLMAFVLFVAMHKGHILVEYPSTRRWCTTPPYTLQCYYGAWTNCTPTNASRAHHQSLKVFHGSGRWYGMSTSTARLQPAARDLLFAPRPHIRTHVDAVVAQCGGDAFWTVHIRDSPEKRQERGKLPSVQKYLRQIPKQATRVLWQTSNPLAFRQARTYSRGRNITECYTNFSRHEHDVWGGRDVAYTNEAGITGAVNGELGRRGVGLISLRSSSWNWFLTVGKDMETVLI